MYWALYTFVSGPDVSFDFLKIDSYTETTSIKDHLSENFTFLNASTFE